MNKNLLDRAFLGPSTRRALLKVEQNNLFEKLIIFFTSAEDKLCPQLDLGVKLM